MYNYSFISVTALFCYMILFVAFMAAQKTKIIHSFLVVLAAFLLWTGGSLAMRMELWPGVEFWFHFSIVVRRGLPAAGAGPGPSAALHPGAAICGGRLH